MAVEPAAVLAWLATILKGDATLCSYLADGAAGVARGGIPGVQAAHLPICVYSVTPLDDVLNLQGNYRVLVPGLYTVKIIGKREDYSDKVVPAANRLDTLLAGARGSQSGVWVRSCIRQVALAYSEDDPGMGWIDHLGGQWHIEAQQVP